MSSHLIASVGTSSGPDALQNFPLPRIHRRKHDERFRPEASFFCPERPTRRDRRIGSNSLHRTLPSPEIPADNPHVSAIVVGNLRYLLRFHFLITGRRHL